MKKLMLFLAIVLLCAIWGCDDRDDNLTGPNIRIQNLTSVNFTMVEVVGDSIIFDNVAAEGFSEYQEFDEAFEQMALKVTTDSIEYNFTPAELPFEALPIGLYTYQLFISAENEIELDFRVD